MKIRVIKVERIEATMNHQRGTELA